MNHANLVLGVLHVLQSQNFDEVHIDNPGINENII